MQNEITLVDRGRGLQLSTSRITVHDLVPYFQQGCSYDEIIRWIPSLSREEIAVVECYYRAHKDALDEYERGVMAYREEKIQEQRRCFPEREESHAERLARLTDLLRQRRQERKLDAGIFSQVSLMKPCLRKSPRCMTRAELRSVRTRSSPTNSRRA